MSKNKRALTPSEKAFFEERQRRMKTAMSYIHSFTNLDQPWFLGSLSKTLVSDITRQPCAHCHQPGKFLCAACVSAVYCSRECQMKQWPYHSPYCLDVKQSPKQPVVPQLRYCDVCRHIALITCGACESKFYCTKACQQKGWPSHRSECNSSTRQYTTK
eukprot:m.52569 g.52569  ORF g.52569 m.52569 type:complete len:159 (+) comp7625_c0_seq1:162-638(+)